MRFTNCLFLKSMTVNTPLEGKGMAKCSVALF